LKNMFNKKSKQLKQIGNTGVYSSYQFRPRRRFLKTPRFSFGALKGGLTVLISVLIIFTVVKAGTITPPSGTPTAQFYTLSEIYTRLTTNAAATEGGHSFTFSDSLAGGGYTLTQIYDAIPAIIANTVKLGATYLGIDGSLTPIMTDGTATTTAVAADVFSGLTAHLSADWTLGTGTLTLACATSTFDGTANLVGNTYDGDGDGTNRWCITDADDITSADVLSGKIAWISGATTTGTMANNGSFSLTASSTDQSVTAGYYSGGTLLGDTDLATGNIKSGVTIFGVSGDSNVVDTSSGDATAANIATGTIAYVGRDRTNRNF
jgi:hypothetical protein